jgi:starvation-inducible outer membrane lipoprotein
MTATKFTALIAALALLLAGCKQVDAIFGPPFDTMTQEQIGAYCSKWPADNMCQRWQAGEFRGAK